MAVLAGTVPARHNDRVPEPVLLPIVETPIACSLDAAQLTDRLADWRRVLAGVTARADGAGPHEVILQLGSQTSVSELATLCKDEVACCPFFTFDLRLSAEGMALQIRVPPEAASVLAEFAGAVQG